VDVHKFWRNAMHELTHREQRELSALYYIARTRNIRNIGEGLRNRDAESALGYLRNVLPRMDWETAQNYANCRGPFPV
jgi:hypothetical protein